MNTDGNRLLSVSLGGSTSENCTPGISSLSGSTLLETEECHQSLLAALLISSIALRAFPSVQPPATCQHPSPCSPAHARPLNNATFSTPR